MNYYILRYHMKKYEKNGIMAYHTELHGIDTYQDINGEVIENWHEGITFSYNEEEGNIDTDYICNDLGWLIVSEKFKNAIETQKIRGIQYLPLSIRNIKSGEILGVYYLANIVNLVEAIEMEQSEFFELFPGKYSFVKYAIKEKKVSNLDVFRLRESNIEIFVSEKFKKIIEDSNLTGFTFDKIKVV